MTSASVHFVATNDFMRREGTPPPYLGHLPVSTANWVARPGRTNLLFLGMPPMGSEAFAQGGLRQALVEADEVETARPSEVLAGVEGGGQLECVGCLEVVDPDDRCGACA